MLGATAGGRLLDHFGCKAGLVGSVALFGCLSILTGFVCTAHELIGARFLTGIGLGGALPNLLAIVTERVPAARRRAVVGMLYAGLPFGGALPLLAVLPLPPFLLAIAFPPEQSGGGFARAVFGEGRAVASLLLWAGFSYGRFRRKS